MQSDAIQRIDKAIDSQFYLEAITLIYACIENRTKRILELFKAPSVEASLFTKLKCIEYLSENNSDLAKHIDKAFIDN